MTELNSKFCAFCDENDVPSAGVMLLVLEGTQEEIGREPDPQDQVAVADAKIGVCADCGPQWTDRTAAENPETGQVAVFQFEHQDYHKVTEEQHASLVAQFETNVCSLCDEVLWPEGNQREMPTRDLVTKLLRQAPDGITLSQVCGRCTELGLCPDCGPDHEH